MKRLFGMAGAAVACTLLAACGTQLETARSTVPAGTDFDNALYGEYVELAQFEYGEADYRDSDLYAERAILVARGEAVEPTAIEARALPADAVGGLTDARQRLMTAFGTGAKSAHPKPAARAQAMFDCWMEQQEENTQPTHIAHCRDEFEKAVAMLKPAMAAPAADPQSYRVYFAHNSAALNQEAMQAVRQAAATYGTAGYGKIGLYGYTDTSGSADYNNKLAAQRATAVQDALVQAGVPAGSVRVSVRGEYSLPKPTADGVREQDNRLVIIRVAP